MHGAVTFPQNEKVCKIILVKGEKQPEMHFNLRAERPAKIARLCYSKFA